MNKQIILNQCDKIKDVVKDATQNEEEARSNAEKFKEIKESNTKLLSILNSAKDIYWELERTLRIIEIDKEYDNTSDELENLKIRVKDLISDLEGKVEDLNSYDSVKETVEFYKEAIKDANEFVDGDATKRVETPDDEDNSADDIDFSFDKAEEVDTPFNFDDDILNVSDEEKASESDKEEETPKKEETSSNDDDLNTFDFSSMYGFDSKEDEHEDKQRVVSVTDFSDSIAPDEEKEAPKEDVKENITEEDKSSEDTSLDELNDLFNYLNSDNSFNE